MHTTLMIPKSFIDFELDCSQYVLYRADFYFLCQIKYFISSLYFCLLVFFLALIECYLEGCSRRLSFDTGGDEGLQIMTMSSNIYNNCRAVKPVFHLPWCKFKVSKPKNKQPRNPLNS